MILLVGGWYFIVSGVLSLLPILLGMSTGKEYLTWIAAPLMIVVGVGLIKHQLWSRWIALGLTLVGWTLGTLFFLAFLYFIFGRLDLDLGDFFSAVFSDGFAKVGARMALLGFIIWVAGIVICYRLFWYLWSEEGCEQFGALYGDKQAVVASTAVWLGAWTLLLMATGDGPRAVQAIRFVWAITSPDGKKAFGLDRSRSEIRSDLESRQRQRDNERRRMELEARELRERRQREERERALIEAAQREEQLAGSGGYPPGGQGAESAPAPASGEFEVPREYVSGSPVSVAPEEDSTNTDSRRILKCRDASGTVTFTQGYCPPGTQLVEPNP